MPNLKLFEFGVFAGFADPVEPVVFAVFNIVLLSCQINQANLFLFS